MVGYLSNHYPLKASQNKIIKVNIKPSRKYFPNSMQFSSWLEWHYLPKPRTSMLDNIPSSDGRVPVKWLASKKIKTKPSKSTSNPQKKYFPNSMQLSSWLEWHRLPKPRRSMLDNIPSSDGRVPVKSLFPKSNPKQNHQSQHQTLTKNIFQTACSFHHDWSGSTYLDRLHLGSTAFQALMVGYLSSHYPLTNCWEEVEGHE